MPKGVAGLGPSGRLGAAFFLFSRIILGKAELGCPEVGASQVCSGLVYRFSRPFWCTARLAGSSQGTKTCWPTFGVGFVWGGIGLVKLLDRAFLSGNKLRGFRRIHPVRLFPLYNSRQPRAPPFESKMDNGEGFPTRKDSKVRQSRGRGAGLNI